jgi:hypothetical protein
VLTALYMVIICELFHTRVLWGFVVRNCSAAGHTLRVLSVDSRRQSLRRNEEEQEGQVGTEAKSHMKPCSRCLIKKCLYYFNKRFVFVTSKTYV